MVHIYVIFTDLDGTLLDENYSYEDALPVLETLKRKNVPIIFCSGKTKSEMEVIRRKTGIYHPFIVEDGSAIYIPRNYFGEVSGKVTNGFEVIVLGVEFEKIAEEIERVRKKYYIKCYSHLTIEEVARITGLSIEEAKLAKQREFSETVVEASDEALEALRKKFNIVIGGRFVHVFGKHADKGKAVRILTDLYRKKWGEVTTVGIGNSYTDEPMLRAVDIPAIVKNPDGTWAELRVENLYRANAIGPKGWVEVIKTFVKNVDDYERK